MTSNTTGHTGLRNSPMLIGCAQSTHFAGLVSGAQVLTLKGTRLVDTLRVGDRVLTRGGALPIQRLEAISVLAPAVYVIAGSLSHSRSDRDAFLTSDQTINLRDWRATALYGKPMALARAGDLIDGEFVRDIGQQLVTLYRIFFAMPQTLFCDGLELGSADAAHYERIQPTT